MRQSWICQRCNASLAPHVDACPQCLPVAPLRITVTAPSPDAAPPPYWPVAPFPIIVPTWQPAHPFTVTCSEMKIGSGSSVICCTRGEVSRS